MSTYVIGDVQGCWRSLQALLNKIEFDQDEDVLWFAGDLINRGPNSLDVLYFVYALQNAIVVLGNHDLHFLACYYGQKQISEQDTFQDILAAPFVDKLAEWLCHQPLCYVDETHQAILTHAGIPPYWSLEQALQYANEVESILQSNQRNELFSNMYDQTDQSTLWDDAISGWERSRLIINHFTRMRFIDNNNNLNLSYKGEIKDAPNNLTPWFDLPRKEPLQCRLYFGHWAALQGHCTAKNIEAVDGGCVWGNHLIAVRLEDQQRFEQKSLEKS